MNIDEELKKVHERNARVEADKAWERSWTRRGFIAGVTYVVAAAWLVLIHDPHPMLNALVPVAGFVLSTLSLPFLRRRWLEEFFAPRRVPEAREVRTEASSAHLGVVGERSGSVVVEGVVGRGKREGSEIGFPTINLAIAPDDSIDSGIFAGKVHLLPKTEREGLHSYFAALYIPHDKNLIEAHLLDFSGDLYGARVRIEIGKKVRDSIAFASVEAAKEKIKEDIKAIEKIFFGSPNF